MKIDFDGLKINIGGGDQRYEGFLNCDYDKNCSPDYCFNLEKDKFPFEDNTVSQVIAHHVFEHMGEGYFHCLQELYRVCRHGAIIDIRVPCPRHQYYLDDPTHRRPITPGGLSLFSKKYNDACKEQGAAASRLAYYYGVNFEIVHYMDIPDPKYLKEFDGIKREEAERYIYEHNGIVMEYHIKLIVVKHD